MFLFHPSTVTSFAVILMLFKVGNLYAYGINDDEIRDKKQTNLVAGAGAKGSFSSPQ